MAIFRAVHSLRAAELGGEAVERFRVEELARAGDEKDMKLYLQEDGLK